MPTKIEWADEVWNPVTGCTKVSAGCKNCYAERMAKRFWGDREFTDVQFHEDRLDQPVRWKKPRKIFVNSMSDLFHPDVPFEFVVKVFSIMAKAYQHTFMILTKRSGRMGWFYEYFEDKVLTKDCTIIWPLPNVWIGVSAENQQAAEERIPVLLRIPAAKRFVSCEPLLGPVDLWGPKYDNPNGGKTGAVTTWPGGLDLVIVGGESGPGARPMHPDWVRSLRDQCVGADVPFFFKQWGRYTYSDRLFSTYTRWVNKARGWLSEYPNVVCVDMDGKRCKTGADFMNAHYPVAWGWYEGKKAAGRLLDGREWNGDLTPALSTCGEGEDRRDDSA